MDVKDKVAGVTGGASGIGKGIGVSLLTPAAVLTPILAGKEDTPEGQDAITT